MTTPAPAISEEAMKAAREVYSEIMVEHEPFTRRSIEAIARAMQTLISAAETRGKRESIPLAAHGSEKSRHPHSPSLRLASSRDNATTGTGGAPPPPVPATYSPWRTKSKGRL